MPLLNPHHRALLRLGARPEGVLVAGAAGERAMTRQTAGSYLRRLERAALLRAELVDGGRLRYTTTADGLIEVDRHAAVDAARGR